MTRLVVSRGEVFHCECQLGETDIRVGSDSSDDIVLADADVSGRHAELRFHEGQYVIYDLGSESGVWVDGQRVSQATLAPGVSVAVGPFHLRVDSQPRANPAAADAPTLYAGPPTQHAPMGAVASVPPNRTGHSAAPAVGADRATVYARAGQPPVDTARSAGKGSAAPASRPATPIARSKTETKPTQAAAPTSLVARLARLPKPVLFGGVSFLLILILALRVLTAPTTDVPRTSASVTEAEPKQAAPNNAETIAAHLERGRARNKRGEYEAAIREDFDPILLIEKTNTEALSLKAEAEEGLRKPRPAEPVRPEAEATAVSPSLVPERATATSRPRETGTTGRAGADALLLLYNQATTAIRAEDYAAATAALESIVREDPRYRDAAKRLEDVRQAQAERAKAALDAALTLEQDDELIKARIALDRACTMPQASPACADASKRVAEKIRSSGNEAFRRAKVFDGQGRLPEAIALYERAFQFLAADDTNRQIAKERLEFLKSRR